MGTMAYAYNEQGEYIDVHREYRSGKALLVDGIELEWTSGPDSIRFSYSAGGKPVVGRRTGLVLGIASSDTGTLPWESSDYLPPIENAEFNEGLPANGRLILCIRGFLALEAYMCPEWDMCSLRLYEMGCPREKVHLVDSVSGRWMHG